MSKQNIFVGVFVLILGVTGYLWYGYFQVAPADTGSGESRDSSFLQVSRLQNVQLDTSLLEDPLFLSLSPPQIIPQPDVTPGRANPFIPF